MFDSKEIDLYSKYMEFARRLIADKFTHDMNNYVEIISIKRKITSEERPQTWTFFFRLSGRTMTKKFVDPRTLERSIEIMSYWAWIRLYLKEERDRRIIELMNMPPEERKKKKKR